MAMRRSSHAAGRDRVLVVSVLTVLLGLRLVGSSLAGPEPAAGVGAQGSQPRTSSILPSTAASPLVVEVHITSDLTPPRGRPLAPRPDTVVAFQEDDPRAYLSKMAALRFRRRLTTPTAPDPYQASLNPTIYIVDAATPTAHDCSVMRAPADQRCRFSEPVS